MKSQFLLFFFLLGCSGLEQSEYDKVRKRNCKGEYIYRSSKDRFSPIQEPKLVKREPYPFEEGNSPHFTRITKEYFRCKGCFSNPPIPNSQVDGEAIQDCKGMSKHGLPILRDKEDVYPILIDLINHIQKKTKKRVIITCGHRCPEHNTYAEPGARTSKHMIGAEVDFYVQGLEESPMEVVRLLCEYYREMPDYQGNRDYEVFSRYGKSDTNVSIPPWYNKEIFIKLYSKGEGRDFDNRHPYPYIGVQVRYDRERDKRVVYTWDQAYRGYLRK